MRKLTVILCMILPSLGFAKSAAFLGNRDYLLAGTPIAATIVDVNHDGIQDAVVGTAGGTQIMLGKGDGTFQPPSTVAGYAVWAQVVADFNNDGYLDIATTILTNGTQVTLSLGKGNGGFRTPIQLPIPCIDCFLAAADFNGDGNMDLAVASTSSVTVFLGNGDGTFTGGLPVYYLQFTDAVLAADVNGDGIPDLIVTDFGAGTEVVLLGNGDGSFSRADYPAGAYPTQAVLADLNGDGRPDLAVSNKNAGTVSVLLNQGSGVFGAPVAYNAGCSPFSGCQPNGVAAGDFNHDGTVDIATPGAILFGNGDGTLQKPQRFQSGLFPAALVSGDFNRDGYSDLMVLNSATTNVTVLLGAPPTVTQPRFVGTGGSPQSMALGDFNGDGNVDIAVAAKGSNQIEIYLGDGNGNLEAGQTFANQEPAAIVAADFNGDGKLDLAVAGERGTSIYLGNGDGTFRHLANYPSFNGSCTITAFQDNAAPCLATADLNGDGIPDLAGGLWITDTVNVMLGNGDGTFRAVAQTLTTPAAPQGIAIADFNHDGKLDLAVSCFFGTMVVYPGNGDGTFGAAISIPTGTTTAVGLAVGDIDGDGNPDIVISGGSGSGDVDLGVYIITGNGDLTFNPPVVLLADRSPNGVVLADFNGDGRLDIASANILANDVSVLLNTGNLTFAPETLYAAGGGPATIASAVLTPRGKPDLVVVDEYGGGLTILLQEQPLVGHGSGTR